MRLTSSAALFRHLRPSPNANPLRFSPLVLPSTSYISKHTFRPFHSSSTTMALPPKFAGLAHRVAPPATPSDASVVPATHTLEVYLDYVCPFSAKMLNTINKTVLPLVKANSNWAHNVTFIIRPQVQPWHPSSTLVHEAALAVLRLAPGKFWEFSSKLMDEQKAYFDVNVVNETRNNTYRRLADLAGQVGVSADEVYKLLAIPEKAGPDGSLNSGNGVTNDLKVVIKMNRLIGVHVTPTVVFDGVVFDISSSWGEKEWEEWLEKNVE